MSNRTIAVSSRIHTYLLSPLREPEVLARLREETARDAMSQMQIAPEQGQLMGFLVQLMGATKALSLIISP